MRAYTVVPSNRRSFGLAVTSFVILSLTLGLPLSSWGQQTKEAPAEAKDPQTLAAEWMKEGRELVDSQDFNAAAAKFKHVLDVDDKNVEAWFMYGYALHLDKQLEPALAAHRKAAEFESGFRPTATYNIACALALLGQPQEALDTLRRSVDLGFADLSFIRNDADLYSLHARTEFAQLVAQLEKKDEVIDQLAKAQAAIDAMEYDAAAEIYSKILADDPNNDFASYRLGYALHGAKQLDEAVKAHEQATKFPGTRGIAFYNWGCALSLQDKKQAALEKLQAAVKNGFVRRDAYESDPDLNNVRNEPEFVALVAKLPKPASRSAEAVGK